MGSSGKIQLAILVGRCVSSRFVLAGAGASHSLIYKIVRASAAPFGLLVSSSLRN